MRFTVISKNLAVKSMPIKASYKLMMEFKALSNKCVLSCDFTKKAGKKLYSLRVLRRAGVCQGNILKIYLSTVCPVLEYAVPVWQAIPTYLSDVIERIKKGHST